MPQDASRVVRQDVAFHVPFVHRLRFTTDVFGRDQTVLAELLQRSGEQPARVQFWVDEFVWRAHPELKSRIRAFVAAHKADVQMPGNIQIVPGGEAVKNDVHLLERMLKCIHAADLDRRSYIVVIGGGAVLDAVGLAAAVSHRGIRLVRLPTTTLAQADSGVGVKNSVNLFGKKNWIGTFAVPWGVVNDAALLETLPQRDFLCGFAEAVKVSLLKDPAVFDELCANAAAIRARDMDRAWPIIRRSAEMHLDHITRGGDPFEALEARPLDFGHWSAHKLEVLSEFDLRHGEAVAIGVAIDTVYSSMVHGLPSGDCDRVLKCLSDLGLPLSHPALEQTDALFAGLEEFRQHLGGRLTLTMLRGIGEPLDAHEVDLGAMREAILRIQSRKRQRRKPEPEASATETRAGSVSDGESDPLAYFITFTTYGTWLRRRDPGWVDRQHNVYDTPVLAPDQRLETAQRAGKRQAAYTLDQPRRDLVLRTILEVSSHRKWHVWAAHVRTNHVHVVVTAGHQPEKVMVDFKTWCSRRLREEFSEEADRDRWTQHGSTRYLWKESILDERIEYVVNGQGVAMAVFDGRDKRL